MLLLIYIKGKDGLVRSVSLRISSGSELLRPIEKLYPLEVSSENNAQGIEKEDKEAIANKLRFPLRLAAQKAIHRIREQSQMNTWHERYQIHYDTILKLLSFANHSILFLS